MLNVVLKDKWDSVYSPIRCKMAQKKGLFVLPQVFSAEKCAVLLAELSPHLTFLTFCRVAVKKFDDKLMELYKMRLAIEKCILAEELKILLHDRQMSGDCFFMFCGIKRPSNFGEAGYQLEIHCRGKS